ncbi:DUF58 domain-containing protein [Paenibacillus contaminans]|uniref:DUF58 domain-containing protein n=1 Tax=Paenibacillus contaminans TaxID=450362 RepID=A0A329MJD9_9BACL|nr:DUF58 domain-containing protein [Paenibacillus contaminans]RAV19752.1 DUF58 domain-containing protein [Paenibacillus contaminans]
MSVTASQPFLPEDVLRKLERCVIAGKSRIRGTMQGRRRSRELGSSLEFADYRLYSPGDDIRRLDWHAYGRTGKPFIKLFTDEQEMQVHLLIDASASMAFTAGGGAQSKFEHAKHLAAAVGYAALCGYDSADVSLFGSSITSRLPLLRGKGAAGRMFEFLRQAPPEREGDLRKALTQPAAMPRQPGMTWIFSDFLFEDGVEETLKTLLAAKQEVVVVQVLAEEEWNPQLSGDLRLLDIETGMGKEVAISRKVLDVYRETVKQYTESLRRFCRERGITYEFVLTSAPLAETVVQGFRRSGLIR